MLIIPILFFVMLIMFQLCFNYILVNPNKKSIHDTKKKTSEIMNNQHTWRNKNRRHRKRI